jgi:ABC-2 type transport system permease protein
MRELRLGRKIIGTLIKNSAYNPQRIILDFFALVARCGILLFLYKCVYNWKGSNINNTSYQVIAWSIFLYFIVSIMRPRDITDAIAQDVKTGSIEMILNKPIHYLSYRFYTTIGTGLYSFFILAPLGFLAMALTLGIPSTMTTHAFVLTCTIVGFLCIALSLIVHALLGVLAFWMEDITPVYWIVDKFVMVLGGSYLPVAFFPPVMYQMAIWSPFGAMQFITHTVYDSWAAKAWNMIGIQLFWTLLFGLTLLIVFRKAKERISVNGG